MGGCSGHLGRVCVRRCPGKEGTRRKDPRRARPGGCRHLPPEEVHRLNFHFCEFHPDEPNRLHFVHNTKHARFCCQAVSATYIQAHGTDHHIACRSPADHRRSERRGTIHQAPPRRASSACWRCANDCAEIANRPHREYRAEAPRAGLRANTAGKR
jgi:hypothetical protein